jgi:hypothetical protein
MDQLSRKRIVWAGIFSSTFIFILIAFVLKIAPNNGKTLSLNPAVTYILFGVGMSLLVVSHFLPKITQIQKSEKASTIDPIFIIALAINEMGSFVAFFLKLFFNNSEASMAMFAATIIAFLAKYPKDLENN